MEDVDTSELAERLEAERARVAASESSTGGGGTESMMSWALEKASWRYSVTCAPNVGMDENDAGPSVWRAEWRAAIGVLERRN